MTICLMPLKIDVGDPVANMQRIERILPNLLSKSPDLICFPECTLTGYLFEGDDLNKFGETIPGPTTKKIGAIAKENDVQLCFGLIERTSEGFYNSAVLINEVGEIVVKYRKINEKPPYLQGGSFFSFPFNGKRCGLIICGDLFYHGVNDWLDETFSLLLVLMSRGFPDDSPNIKEWENIEKQIYVDRVKELGVRSLFVNALEINVESGSFGGAFVIDSNGMFLKESPHGTDKPLYWDPP